MGVEKKTILITGTTPGGIGAALALAAHAKGYRVFATGRTLSKLQPLAAKGIEVLQLDVSNSESITDLKHEIIERTGGSLDILVNNAGTWLEAPAIENDLHKVKQMYDTNVFGPMEMVQQFTPLLLISHGTIVNLGSVLGIMPYPFTSAYNGSKAALAQWSETLRIELEPLKIKVMTVVTGQVATNLPQPIVLPESSIYKPIQTQLDQRTKAHMDKGTTPEVFAAGLLKAIAAPKPWFWLGTNSTVTWLVSTFAPRTGFVSILFCSGEYPLIPNRTRS